MPTNTAENKKFKLIPTPALLITDVIRKCNIEEYYNKPCSLYQIEALRDIGNQVKKGDVGGYVSSEKNLNWNDDSWIEQDSAVVGNAYVTGNSLIRDSVIINSLDDPTTWPIGGAYIENAIVYNSGITCPTGGAYIVYYGTFIIDSLITECTIYSNTEVLGAFSVIDQSTLNNVAVCRPNKCIADEGIQYVQRMNITNKTIYHDAYITPSTVPVVIKHDTGFKAPATCIDITAYLTIRGKILYRVNDDFLPDRYKRGHDAQHTYYELITMFKPMSDNDYEIKRAEVVKHILDTALDMLRYGDNTSLQIDITINGAKLKLSECDTFKAQLALREACDAPSHVKVRQC